VLTRLADALDALPDSRAGDVTALAAEKVRADGQRMGRAPLASGPAAPEVKGALVLTSSVLSHLASVVYDDSPHVRSSTTELERIVALIREDVPIAAQRETIQAALDAAEVTLELIESAAVKSPYPTRLRDRPAR
jgi:hypothetical protein